MNRRNFLQMMGAAALSRSAGAQDIKLPLRDKSVRFAVIGDNGTGDNPQYEVADQMAIYQQKVKFDFVLMLGDNIYGGSPPRISRKSSKTRIKS